MDVSRIEMVTKVEAQQREAHAIFPGELKFFRQLDIQREELWKPSRVRVPYAHKVLFDISYGERKAAAPFKDGRDTGSPRQTYFAPGDQSVRHVKRKIRELIGTDDWRCHVPKVSVEVVQIALRA